MESTTDRLAVTRELVIDAAPETVWGLLVDPQKIVRWMGVEATFEARPGAPYRIVVLPSHVAVGEVVTCDPPRRLAYTWGWESGDDRVPPGSTTIEFELEPEGDGTRLRFVHRDLPDAGAAQGHGRGWDHYVGRLAVVAAGGDAGRDPWLDRGD